MKVVFNYLRALDRCNLPKRLKDELEKLFEKHLAQTLRKSRQSSGAIALRTQERRLVSLIAGFEELRVGGFALESPWNIGQKHIAYLVKLWVGEKNQAPGTVENKLSYWRSLAEWMKKPGLVGTVDDYIKRPEGYRRYYVAKTEDAWTEATIDVEDVIARVADKNPWVAVQLELQAAFGLQAEESMLLHPLQCLRVSGHLQVVDGTRTGRPRVVPVDARWQYELLIRAAGLANSRTGSMIPDPWTKKKWYGHFYAVLQGSGVARKEMGVSIHVLRRAYRQHMYEKSVGVQGPVTKPDHHRDPELHQWAIKEIVTAAGHEVLTNAGAYIFSFAERERTDRTVITCEQARAALEHAKENKTRAAKALGIPRPALYRLLASKS
jgi:Integrase/Bacterial regulatory protein, Fis family